ncbi:RNA polymerase sigma-70 factor, ECF subfamily [Prosthecobacter debontii]|uniref:RNA polymerase sigma-70 factor, ECF subfamily n=1 Tax=Prosthecobacter debontii TaxID=48467 RepID=A0A1T4X8J8_9BACT|nr:RNA polymerase sigma factor [Prosthecobacter debontii]SKA85932.1 RNA polymerase sigma-70 factor, ECF subfamily [Prosthecobacter debontii]
MIASPDDEDNDLMMALAGGNDPALNILIRRWTPRLISYVERLCGCHATACDLAQETFVRVYKHRQQFRPAHKFSTWLFTIATNLMRNHSRWQKRHPVTLLDPHETHALPLESGHPSPDGDLENKERAAAIQRAIGQLPAEQKEALILSTYEGLSHGEIAEIMGTREKVIEMRIYRARKQLREWLHGWLQT